jgi:hypothetical protein
MVVFAIVVVRRNKTHRGQGNEMATTLKGYRFYITAQPETDATITHNARTAHDSWQINAEASVARARMRGEVVWLSKLTRDDKGTVYVTAEQAQKFGLCVASFCGQPATVIGFSGLRCGAHAKGGESLLCVEEDCTQVSETGFSSWCTDHTTPVMREAREKRQAELRARATAPYRY